MQETEIERSLFVFVYVLIVGGRGKFVRVESRDEMMIPGRPFAKTAYDDVDTIVTARLQTYISYVHAYIYTRGDLEKHWVR